MNKPRLSFWQIFSMSFGFMGIQFGWGLQLANMSGIYTYLGANSDAVPLLWLAGPMTGLIVQPIIGSMSDRTWNRLGRRRPYFLTGAILASIALFFMPDSSALWMAVSLLWILDTSINISMEPFRAFVADKLNVEQRTAGFVMQSFFIGVGASLANALPLVLRQLGVTGKTPSGIPFTLQYSFKIGAVAFLLCVLWTVITTGEYPPYDMAEFERKRSQTYGNATGLAKILRIIIELIREISDSVWKMPQTMKQLAVVQLFTWLGLFCMWLFFGLTTSYHVFGAKDAIDTQFALGQEWGGWAFAVYSIVCFAIAFLLPSLAKATSRKTVHAASLICGGLGLVSVYFIHDKYMLLVTMVGVGIAWASILSMPYAILSGALPPARIGVYMGIFNFFIVIPEIIASLFFGRIIRSIFGANSTTAPMFMVMAGGAFMLIAAALVTTVRDVADIAPTNAVMTGDEHELFTIPESAQPVPSTGLNDPV